MKHFVTYFCFFIISNFLFADSNLVALRTELNEAAEDKTIAQSFFNKMTNINEQSPPILIGFKAISILIMGKHSFNPYTKLKYFYWGKDLLDKAIEKEKSLELHFFRFAVQTNIPSFLPYTGDIQIDKEIIYIEYADVTPKGVNIKQISKKAKEKKKVFYNQITIIVQPFKNRFGFYFRSWARYR